MCGIYFSYGHASILEPSAEMVEHLCRRGPDHKNCVHVKHSSGSLNFIASVLSLRGEVLTQQPLHDSTSGSILCWNGEAWRFRDAAVSGNDADAVFKILLKSLASNNVSLAFPDKGEIDRAVLQDLDRISGPYAFIFYHAISGQVFYGRDPLGRRSLVRSKGIDGTTIISSISSGSSTADWAEIETDGIYVLHLPGVSDNRPEVVERRISRPKSSKKQQAVSRPSS